MQNNQMIEIKAHIDMSEISEATAKLEQLTELLEKANSQINELANNKIKLSVELKP